LRKSFAGQKHRT